MILYYALTTYHIQCCVLHRLTKKPDEEAVLLLSDIHKNSVAFLSRYRESKIFDNVFLLEESQVNSAARQNEAKHKPHCQQGIREGEEHKRIRNTNIVFS